MCEECPGYPTKCSVCGYENHLIASEICSSCVTAIKHEQERIIKLLEAIKGEEKACCVECQPHLDTHRQYLTVLIDMIKE